ncbi:Paneth cell-specific alpha-defensin 36L precursor [Equus caballus]|uniref:Paneth cell-specific alpha-defensin 36L n=1 Tax=Equus caballus TaxID=9796 RepID=C8BNI9_HORSE|nr:Paneth cell-specific alpha-defensin 36L precursor [Equus caballus]ACV49762.1 Paneth cell-specific alpha-defensin 36L [Equus caballus]
MRTLALLAALLLLVFQAQAKPLGEKDDQVPARDEPGAKVPDTIISFEGDERATRQVSGHKKPKLCVCRVLPCFCL